MPAVVVHERGCDCLRSRTDVLMERRERSVPLEMADGRIAPVRPAHRVLDRIEEAAFVAEETVVPGTTEYGVRCSSLDGVVWWNVYTEPEARERMAEADRECDWPHLLVTREW